VAKDHKRREMIDLNGLRIMLNARIRKKKVTK
jgi:hypothetical protein